MATSGHKVGPVSKLHSSNWHVPRHEPDDPTLLSSRPPTSRHRCEAGWGSAMTLDVDLRGLVLSEGLLPFLCGAGTGTNSLSRQGDIPPVPHSRPRL